MTEMCFYLQIMRSLPSKRNCHCKEGNRNIVSNLLIVREIVFILFFSKEKDFYVIEGRTRGWQNFLVMPNACCNHKRILYPIFVCIFLMKNALCSKYVQNVFYI